MWMQQLMSGPVTLQRDTMGVMQPLSAAWPGLVWVSLLISSPEHRNAAPMTNKWKVFLMSDLGNKRSFFLYCLCGLLCFYFFF